MSVTYKERDITVSDTTKNIKTYRLVEIPINGNSISTQPACPLKPHQTFNIGAHYKIATRILEKIYECKAYIDVIEENPNECLDLVIMKQIAGPYTISWPLTESDCEFLHIDYENGLLVFPATYDFKLVK